MSKKLFTRLDLAPPHSHSEHAVAGMLEGIITACADRLQEKQMGHLSKHILTREVMYREVNSLAQAFPRRPHEHPLPEDHPHVPLPSPRTCRYARERVPSRPKSRGPSNLPPPPRSPSISSVDRPAVPTNTQPASQSSPKSRSGSATSGPATIASLPSPPMTTKMRGRRPSLTR